MNSDEFFTVFSTATMLFLVLDPLGNLPFFVSLLKDCDAKGYRRIVLRESCIALAVLLLFVLARVFAEGTRLRDDLAGTV